MSFKNPLLIARSLVVSQQPCQSSVVDRYMYDCEYQYLNQCLVVAEGEMAKVKFNEALADSHRL